MQAGLHVIVVNDLDLIFAQCMAEVSVQLAELPHNRAQAVTLFTPCTNTDITEA